MPRKSKNAEIPELWELAPVWTALSTEERDMIRKNLSVHTFRKNEMIHCEGEMPTHAMVLAAGKVKVFKQGTGRNQIMRMLKQGATFGYRAMIVSENYNNNVCAFERSVVYMIRKEAFLTLLRTNHKFCYFFLCEVSKDLGAADIRSINLTQKHIRGRLAEAILSLRKNYGLEDDGATINMYMSREDLANLSNMTTSNAIRTLSNFAVEGLVSIDGRKIKILNLEMLQREAKLG